MSEYRYKNIPLTPSIAAELIVAHLSGVRQPTLRGDIIKYVEDGHRTLGGTSGRDPIPSIKKALNRLVDEGKINRHAVGWYSLTDNASGGGVGEEAAAQSPVSDPEDANELLTPEDTEGEGDELVYVYFHEADRKLANHEGRNWWPCKVGFTAGNLTSRILGQGPATSMARLPTVGLVIKSNDGRGLERAIHFALDEAETRIDEALGNEWFETSPQRIMDWYRMHQQAVAFLRR